MKLKDAINQKTPPVDQEFWAHVERFLHTPPGQKNEHDHNREIRFRVSPEIANYWMSMQKAVPEDWFKSGAAFFRAIMHVGVHTTCEYMKTHDLIHEDSEIVQLRGIFMKLAKIETKLMLNDLRLKAGAIKESLHIKEKAKVIPILNRIMNAKESDNGKKEEAG